MPEPANLLGPAHHDLKGRNFCQNSALKCEQCKLDLRRTFLLSGADKGVYSRESNARPVSRFLTDLNTVEEGNRLVSGHGAGGRGGATSQLSCTLIFGMNEFLPKT